MTFLQVGKSGHDPLVDQHRDRRQTDRARDFTRAATKRERVHALLDQAAVGDRCLQTASALSAIATRRATGVSSTPSRRAAPASVPARDTARTY